MKKKAVKLNKTIQFDLEDLKLIFRDSQTGKGSRNLSTEELEQLLPIIKERKMYIPAMETYQRKTDDHWPLRLDFCIIWEEAKTHEDSLNIELQTGKTVYDILDRIRAEGKEMKIQIWLDDLTQSKK